MLMHTRVYIEKKLCTLESAQTSSLCVTDRPPQGAVPRPGKSKKADLGSSEGRAPFGDAVRERLIGRPLEI